MNNLSSFLIALLIPFMGIQFQAQTHAQTKITEGHLVMEITEVNMPGQSGNPEAEMALDMMKGSTMELYFTSDKELTVTNMMGGMSLVRNLTDIKQNRSVMYMDMMGQKMKVDLGTMEDLSDEDLDYEIIVNKDNRKKLAGFDCYEVKFLARTQGQNIEMTVFVTEEIQVKSSLIQGIQKNPLPGMPLAMEMNVMGMTMKYEAKEFNRNFDKSVFNIDEKGYQEMNMEQLQRMGMGF